MENVDKGKVVVNSFKVYIMKISRPVLSTHKKSSPNTFFPLPFFMSKNTRNVLNKCEE